MKKIISIILLTFLFSCSTNLLNRAGTDGALFYEVDLTDRSDDSFKVTLFVNDLKEENAIYQFASTAPGTYQVMDIGRFVRNFTVYDKSGNEIGAEQVTTNQWKITTPEKAAKITYRVLETWDTAVDSNRIYPMAGTSLEDDHAVINGQAVFGYPTGMQKRALKINIKYPEQWMLGTALKKVDKGLFIAKDFDQIVDSPILLGKLTKATLNVLGTDIDVFAYSQKEMIKAEDILNGIQNILIAAGSFTDGLPVKRYTFLFHFEDKSFPGGGAWEHNYSSFYTFGEKSAKRMLHGRLLDTVAHEFFHVITPLNLHSEVIQHFNFVKPQASEHLWLYEGTTEWASELMQLRGKIKSLEAYFKDLQYKLSIDDRFDKSYSLSKLSLTSFTKEGQRQYYNIYNRGAVVAGLLDLKLLYLSDGKRGLRDVINDLTEEYGPEKPFDEKTFFKKFTEKTYPEIEQFFKDYVQNANPLPLKELYGKFGIEYYPTLTTEQMDTTSGIGVGFNQEQMSFFVEGLEEETQIQGIKVGDVIKAVNGEELTTRNFRMLFGKMHKLGLEENYVLNVIRDGEAQDVTLHKIVIPHVEEHLFRKMENPTLQQQKLFNSWIQNL